MAQKIQTTFIDDIDGSEAEGTVYFGLDGSEYEIDLNAEHGKELRSTLGKYVDHARKVPASGAGYPARRQTRRRPAAPDGPSNTEIKAWAREQGLQVNDRGRIPANIKAQYEAAQQAAQKAPAEPEPEKSRRGRGHNPPKTKFLTGGDESDDTKSTPV